MVKGRGYAWGLSSAILSSIPVTSPFWAVIIGSVAGVKLFDEFIFQILFLGLPPIGFVVAFIGKVRSDYGTCARKLCNIGAGIGIVMSAILIWSMIGVLLQDVFSVPEYPAVITGLVDTILISGYFLIAYIRGKVLWFI